MQLFMLMAKLNCIYCNIPEPIFIANVIVKVEENIYREISLRVPRYFYSMLTKRHYVK